MQISTARIQTENPERLMTRLCKHWGHKFPVKLSEREGEIQLSTGTCRLRCTELLTVELESDVEQMPKFQQIVADHLQRMAAKETLIIEWQ